MLREKLRAERLDRLCVRLRQKPSVLVGSVRVLDRRTGVITETREAPIFIDGRVRLPFREESWLEAELLICREAR